MDPKAYSNYCLELGTLIREAAVEGKRQMESRQMIVDRSYEMGRQMAYHEIVAVMREQAKRFGLSLVDIGLDGLDPMRDIL